MARNLLNELFVNMKQNKIIYSFNRDLKYSKNGTNDMDRPIGRQAKNIDVFSCACMYS